MVESKAKPHIAHTSEGAETMGGIAADNIAATKAATQNFTYLIIGAFLALYFRKPRLNGGGC